MKKSKGSILLIVSLVCAGSISYGRGGGIGEGKIPFRMLGQLVTVTVKIDDSPKKFNFVVDTGGQLLCRKRWPMTWDSNREARRPR
jgi:hypothetical protein